MAEDREYVADFDPRAMILALVRMGEMMMPILNQVLAEPVPDWLDPFDLCNQIIDQLDELRWKGEL